MLPWFPEHERTVQQVKVVRNWFDEIASFERFALRGQRREPRRGVYERLAVSITDDAVLSCQAHRNWSVQIVPDFRLDGHGVVPPRPALIAQIKSS